MPMQVPRDDKNYVRNNTKFVESNNAKAQHVHMSWDPW